MLLALEAAALAVIAVAYLALAEGSRWLLVFVLLVAALAVWGAQAVDAYREAVRRGGRPGGAIQLLALMPVVILSTTGLLLVGGGSATPAATVQRYVSAWQADRPDAATGLFVQPPDADLLRASWRGEGGSMAERLKELLGVYGPSSQIDPTQPFANLRFAYPGGTNDSDSAEGAEIEIVAVRAVTVDTQLFGIFPVASQQTVSAERLGTIRLRRVPVDRLLGFVDRVWRIETVEWSAGP